MSQDVFKAPKAKRVNPKKKNIEGWSPTKKRKVNDDFLTFCDVVLAYTGYHPAAHDELRAKNNTSPLDSGGSTADSFTSESASSTFLTEEDSLGVGIGGPPQPRSVVTITGSRKGIAERETKAPEPMTDMDSWESVTCFCGKPFAGRPMIECSQCLIWIHLSCAKIRRTSIPDEYICQKCRESKVNKRKSNRLKTEKSVKNGRHHFRSHSAGAALAAVSAKPSIMSPMSTMSPVSRSYSPSSGGSLSPLSSSLPMLESLSPPLPPSPLA